MACFIETRCTHALKTKKKINGEQKYESQQTVTAFYQKLVEKNNGRTEMVFTQQKSCYTDLVWTRPLDHVSEEFVWSESHSAFVFARQPNVQTHTQSVIY